MSALDEFGRDLRAAQDEDLRDPSRRADVRSRLLARPVRARRASPAPRALGGLVLAAAAVLAFALGRPDAALRYTIDADTRPHATGVVVAGAAPRMLRFSDSSTIRLAPSSRARITELDARGAHVNVEHGTASLAIVHRDATDWTVHAGPFLVHVVGTAFDVTWDDGGAVFELAVREGAVWAEGPRLARRLVRAGERVHVELGPRAAAQTQASVQTPAPTPEPVTAPPTREVAERVAPTARTVAAATPSWLELATHGHPDDAWRTAEGAGIDGLVAQLGPDELLRLGDLARRQRDPRAARIYRAVRERHPGTSAAASAAFMLARLDVQRGDLPGAHAGLETYLEEQPFGRYRREALGRLVEVRRALGRAHEAEEAARRYLELHPDGPHAELARRVLGAP